jgi:hypothetical protein
MSDRLNRLAPLTGLVFAALIVVSFFTSPTEPKPSSSGAHVIAFFTKHHTEERVGAVIGTVALVLFVCFAGSLYSRMRRARRDESLGAVSLTGAGLAAAGLTISGSLTWALTDHPARFSPAAAQALNTVAYDMILPTIAGVMLFGVATGLAVRRSEWLPGWLGWPLIVLGIAAASPAFPIALLGVVIWTGAAALLLVRRHDHPVLELDREPLSGTVS